MKRSERTALIVLLFIGIGMWALIGFNFYAGKWQAPLNTPLALPTYTATPEPATPQPTAAAPVTVVAAATLAPSITPYVAPTYAAPQCNGPLTMTILAVGSDTRAPGYLYGLGDVIRLVRVDFVTPRLTVLEFPRDIWVEIPDLDPKHGITHGKLNQAYLYGNKGMGYYNGPSEGPGLLARTLDLNFGARPEYYIAANMQTFVKMVDVIGGVDVTLPETVDARKPDQPERWDLVFDAGFHHLTGKQALMLARIRQPSTFSRADNQNRVLCGVRDALLQPQTLPKLPQLIDTFDEAIQTDLSPQQISKLACLFPKLEPQNITFVTFPLELLQEDRIYDAGVQKEVYIFRADFETLRLYVSAFNKGEWPAPAPDPETVSITATPGKSSVKGGFTCP